MTPGSFRTASVSRRRVLSLAAGVAALASPLRRASAQVTPVASPRPPATPLPSPSTLAADASPQFRAVVEALVAAMQAHQVPGAAIGLLAGGPRGARHGRPRQPSSMRPVTPETLFQIGSLSKTYTATIIWRLIDEGSLALDKPVRTWIPNLTLMDEEVAAKLTIGNLLDHSAGFYGDEGFDTGDDDEGSRATSPIGFRTFPRSSRSAPSSPTTTPASRSSDD